MSRLPFAFAGVLAFALLASACASPPHVPTADGHDRYHTVRKGDTLFSLAQRYGVSVGDIERVNDIPDVNDLDIGDKLRIPGSTRTPIDTRENPWAASHPAGTSGDRLRFVWPVRGRMTSGFGMRSGAHHDGIDIQIPRGTEVRAAESGRVVHSDDSLAGYGHTIIIKHAGRYSTVYAHNRRNLVGVGDFVEKGDLIAESGKSGRATAPHLHFEVRRDGSPRNPLEYLP